MDDREAIRRCQEGDNTAFTVLMSRYKKILYNTAFHITLDRGLAEDLVQETFLEAWQNIRSLRNADAFRAWLVRILMNKANRSFRKKRVSETPLEVGKVGQSEEQGVENKVLQGERRLLVAHAVRSLPKEQRSAVVLHYYTHLSVPEIAKALGWREGTVKSRLHRALAHLRHVLAVEDLTFQEGVQVNEE